MCDVACKKLWFLLYAYDIQILKSILVKFCFYIVERSLLC